MDGPKIKNVGNLTPPSSLPPQKLYPYQIVFENKPLIRNYNQFSGFWVISGHFRAISGVNDVMNGPKIKIFGNLTPPSSLPPQKLYPYQIVGENKPLIRNYNQFSGFWVILGHFRAISGVNGVMKGPKIKNFGNLTPPSSLSITHPY